MLKSEVSRSYGRSLDSTRAMLLQHQEFHDAIVRLLTPCQQEVLLLAYMNGYYDWPRGKTGEELAGE